MATGAKLQFSMHCYFTMWLVIVVIWSVHTVSLKYMKYFPLSVNKKFKYNLVSLYAVWRIYKDDSIAKQNEQMHATLIYNLHFQLQQTFDQQACRGRLNQLACKHNM